MQYTVELLNISVNYCPKNMPNTHTERQQNGNVVFNVAGINSFT